MHIFQEFAKQQICYEELYQEYLECEGPDDWFENSNSTTVCIEFEAILNCYYVKTAELCGLKSAHLLRNIFIDVHEAVLVVSPVKSKQLNYRL